MERPRWLRSILDAVDYWVSVKLLLTVASPFESVPVMVTITVTGKGTSVLPVVLLQPVNRLRPITLAASRTINCKRRRLLKPKKQSATANVASPGNSGKEPW